MGYAENQRLMEQYRELVTNVTERHHQWYRPVQTRLKLNLVLQWATTNPKVTDVPESELAKDDAELLGSEVIALINLKTAVHVSGRCSF
jgi:CO dehydrogenase/acetyl-CoA synthase delta subunit